eukprot:418902_1
MTEYPPRYQYQVNGMSNALFVIADTQEDCEWINRDKTTQKHLIPQPNSAILWFEQWKNNNTYRFKHKLQTIVDTNSTSIKIESDESAEQKTNEHNLNLNVRDPIHPNIKIIQRRTG